MDSLNFLPSSSTSAPSLLDPFHLKESNQQTICNNLSTLANSQLCLSTNSFTYIPYSLASPIHSSPSLSSSKISCYDSKIMCPQNLKIYKTIQKEKREGREEEPKKQMQQKDILKYLAMINKKRYCDYTSLIPNRIIDEPIFMLWGNCVLDFRQSRDLSYEKEASWNKFIKMGKVEINSAGVKFSMSQHIKHTRNMEQIHKILLSYSHKEYKELSESLIFYEKVVAESVTLMQHIKEQFSRKQKEFEALQEQSLCKFMHLKESLIKKKEKENSIYISITLVVDFNSEELVIQEIHLSQKFLNLVGLTSEQFSLISLRRGGLEFYEQFQSMKYMKSLLELFISGKEIIAFQASLKTFDNIDLIVDIEIRRFQVENDEKFLTQGNYLLIQSFSVSSNQLESLKEMRKRNPLNPLIEWEEDFTYTIQSESFIQQYYSKQIQILKKKKKFEKFHYHAPSQLDNLSSSEEILQNEQEIDQFQNRN